MPCLTTIRIGRAGKNFKYCKRRNGLNVEGRSTRRREGKKILIKYLTMGAALSSIGNLYLSFRKR